MFLASVVRVLLSKSLPSLVSPGSTHLASLTVELIIVNILFKEPLLLFKQGILIISPMS
jgi:hypothetical protein